MIVSVFYYTGPPGTPQNLVMSSHCGMNGNQVTLVWTPPTNTGGPSVEIEQYLVNVTGPPGFNCPPDQCNVITTSTTITGLKCNTSYMVIVRAVNCIGVGSPTEPLVITPGK